jgi:CO/xanthine dehydrogenase FAD-binding subunit
MAGRGTNLHREARVKPARFEYFDPRTLPEALDLLAQYGDEGKVLAGGQSLLPLMYLRLASPGYLVDVNRVAGLDYVRVEDDTLCIGAVTRQRAVERAAPVLAGWPLIAEALRQVGHAQIRNRGTFGGSVAHADPAAELPAVVAALDGTLRVAGAGGERTLAADDFFLAYLTTALEPSELLVEVRLPAPPAGSGWAFLEISRRHGDFALVGLACLLALEPDGRHVATARLAYTGVGGTPLRARDAEAVLIGEEAGAAVFARAGELAQAAAEPDSDIHASADYRRHLVGVVTRRALARAHERALAQRARGS